MIKHKNTTEFVKRIREAIADADLLSDPKYNPPAIVVNIPDPKPQAAAQKGISFSSQFLNYIKQVENGSRMGYRRQFSKWFPHPSPEGGRPTIAYGHKLKPGESFSNGITQAQAEALLIKDLTEAWYRADTWLQTKHQVRMDQLSQRQQEMLVDYAFNLGSLGGFPKFVRAVLKNDLHTMRQEYKRTYVTGAGERRELLGRNKAFYSTFLT
jgi:GH24 family phage-related lysozyme (muramidase)